MQIDYAQLPTLNAILNSTSAILLLVGYGFIRKKRIGPHRACMLAAFFVSVLFLVSYVTYHYQVGSVRFQGEGAARILYFGILLSHTVLAIAVAPMAIMTVFRGLRMDVQRHRALARWTLPVWLYVSITGVLVYAMLYHWFAGSGDPLHSS